MPWQASSSWQQLAAASKPSPTSLEPLKYKPISTTQANPRESFEPTLKCSKHVSCKHQLIDSRIICKSKIVKGILALWNPATSLPSMLLCYGSQFFWIARLVFFQRTAQCEERQPRRSHFWRPAASLHQFHSEPKTNGHRHTPTGAVHSWHSVLWMCNLLDDTSRTRRTRGNEVTSVPKWVVSTYHSTIPKGNGNQQVVSWCIMSSSHCTSMTIDFCQNSIGRPLPELQFLDGRVGTWLRSASVCVFVYHSIFTRCLPTNT